jgi:hypothetical protein
VHLGEILVALPVGAKHQRRCDPVHPDPHARERASGQFGEPAKRLLRQSVAEEIGIRRDELRIEQIDDEPVLRRRVAARELLGQKNRSAKVHGHVRVELFRAERPEPVIGKTGGIVHEQPNGRMPEGRIENDIGTIDIGQLGNDLDCAVRHLVPDMMDMRDDVPAVREQPGRNDRANAFACARHDRCTLTHARSVVIPRGAKQ